VKTQGENQKVSCLIEIIPRFFSFTSIFADHRVESITEYEKALREPVNAENEQGSDEVAAAKASVSSPPHVALQNPLIAGLFRHYIDFLAPWYDLNDTQALFGTLVPTRSLHNSVLFRAIIAFSVCHQSRVTGNFLGLGPLYHAACVKDLLVVMDNIQPEFQGDYLAATCLLRSYEILNGESSSIRSRNYVNY